MTNSTPNAQRTNAPQPIDISEAGTVERAIQIEEEMEYIAAEIDQLQLVMAERDENGLTMDDLQEEEDELFIKLRKLQREYRG